MSEYFNKKRYFPQSTSRVEEILNLIARRTNSEPRVSGKGYIVRCPAHEDKKPSLSVGEGHNDRVLLNCFAGCPIEIICDAVGITKEDLSPKKRGG